ncbi:hypothetical protein K438DRAFT_1789388 [Mycena galopus ATCC 62051]|nr:hypothetical protein K438DRAFT_1789388 [Mycena galopus ATCC 62051]
MDMGAVSVRGYGVRVDGRSVGVAPKYLGVAPMKARRNRCRTPRTDEVSGALCRGANAPWKKAEAQKGWGRESGAEILDVDDPGADIVPLACNVRGFCLQRASQNGWEKTAREVWRRRREESAERRSGGVAPVARAHMKSAVKEAARSPSSLGRIPGRKQTTSGGGRAPRDGEWRKKDDKKIVAFAVRVRLEGAHVAVPMIAVGI